MTLASQAATLKKSTTPSALMVKYTDIATGPRTARFLSTEMPTPLILVVLVAAGLASVVPGGRAATATPVETLADLG